MSGDRAGAKAIPILYHPDAEDELFEMSPADGSIIANRVARLSNLPLMEIHRQLHETAFEKVFQIECSHPRGALRIVLAWGKQCLWMIGSFVKHNNAEGKKCMAKIARRSSEVRDWGPDQEFER